MFKTLIFTFILGAVLHGAKGDLNCFLQRQNESLTEVLTGYDGFTGKLCRSMKLYWEGVRNDTKICSTKKFDITKAEAFTKDACSFGWELNERILERQACFVDQFSKKDDNCIWNLVTKVKAKTENGTELRKIGEAVCTEFMVDIYKCLGDQLGTPCGDDGVKLVTQFTTALSPYTKEVCKEIGGASTMSALSWTTLLAILLLTMWHKDD